VISGIITMMIPFSPHSIEGALDFSNTTVFKFNASIKPEININSWKQIPTEKIIIGLRAIGAAIGYSEYNARKTLKPKLVKGRYIFLRFVKNEFGYYHQMYCSYKSLLALFVARYYGLKNIPKVPCMLIIGKVGVANFLGIKEVIFHKKYLKAFEADGSVFRLKIPQATTPCICGFTNMLLASIIKHPELDYPGAMNQYG